MLYIQNKRIKWVVLKGLAQKQQIFSLIAKNSISSGVAELSLDEPELEAVVFTDDGDGDDAHGEEVIAQVEAL